MIIRSLQHIKPRRRIITHTLHAPNIRELRPAALRTIKDARLLLILALHLPTIFPARQPLHEMAIELVIVLAHADLDAVLLEGVAEVVVAGVLLRGLAPAVLVVLDGPALEGVQVGFVLAGRGVVHPGDVHLSAGAGSGFAVAEEFVGEVGAAEAAAVDKVVVLFAEGIFVFLASCWGRGDDGGEEGEEEEEGGQREIHGDTLVDGEV